MKIAKLNFNTGEYAFTAKGVGRFNLQFHQDFCRAYMSISVSKDFAKYLQNNRIELTNMLPASHMCFKQESYASLSSSAMKKLYSVMNYVPKMHLQELPKHVKEALCRKHVEGYQSGTHYRNRILVRVDLDNSLLDRFNELINTPFKEFAIIKHDVMLSIANDALEAIVQSRHLYLQELMTLEKEHNISSKIRLEKLQAKRDALNSVEIIIPEPMVVESPF